MLERLKRKIGRRGVAVEIDGKGDDRNSRPWGLHVVRGGEEKGKDKNVGT